LHDILLVLSHLLLIQLDSIEFCMWHFTRKIHYHWSSQFRQKSNRSVCTDLYVID